MTHYEKKLDSIDIYSIQMLSWNNDPLNSPLSFGHGKPDSGVSETVRIGQDNSPLETAKAKNKLLIFTHKYTTYFL